MRPESLEPLIPKYEAIGRAFLSFMERYSDEELQLICEYMEEASRISARELANLIKTHRARARQN